MDVISCQSNVTYNRDELLGLRNLACFGLFENLFLRFPLKSKRKRGKRGGKKIRISNFLKQVRSCAGFDVNSDYNRNANIPIITTVRSMSSDHCPPTNDRKVNRSNLIQITCSHMNTITNTSSQSAQFCLLNARSINNKSLAIKDFVVDKCIDVLAITETWLNGTASDDVAINNICPTGFLMHHEPRLSSKGGGIALVFKKHYKMKKGVLDFSYRSFEYVNYLITCSSKSIHLIVIYRPPPSQHNNLTVSLFFQEFGSFLESIAILPNQLIIVGDFNFHLDSIYDINTVRLQCILDSFNLKQHVKEPTHASGHILDLIITRASDETVKNVSILDPLISDHFAVLFQSSCFIKKPYARKEIAYRKLKSIDKDQLVNDITSSSLMNFDQYNDASSLADLYEESLKSLVEHHAPLKHRIVTIRPMAPWYSDEIRVEKSKRRRLERRWRKSRLTIDRQLYVNQCSTVNSLIHQSRITFYTNTINENKNNQRVLFSTVSKMLNLKADKKLPSFTNAASLAEKFVEYFENKITIIRNNFSSADAYQYTSTDLEQPRFQNTLDFFSPTSSEELSSLLYPMSSKSSVLDPMPGFLTKHCLPVLQPIIAKIINLSFEHSIVPVTFKEAVLDPLIKKSSLDSEIYKNFRPISNLRFISKSAEKVVHMRLIQHLDDENLHEVFQSAYKSRHSTETALTRIQNDILCAIDNNQCVALVLLDLSAAFDTVDHDILLHRLQYRFGIGDKCISWLKSYLSDRTQFVNIENKFSSSRNLRCGVPQGSVLGPLLYSMYTAPLADIIRSHNMSFHFFADDTQLYLTFNPNIQNDEISAKNRIEACLHDINKWMMSNKLMLNGGKTEFLILHARHKPSPYLSSIKIGQNIVSTSPSAKNIGVWFDDVVSMDKQIRNICKLSFFHLRNIAKVKKYISFKHCEILIHAFVTSRLDNCNSLLSGMSKGQLKKIQCVQNSAARLLMGTKKYDHITTVLINLHWLPIVQRIKFKILILTFKTLNGMAPKYLEDLLQPYEPTRQLRSANKKLLVQPKYVLKSYGSRAFSYVAPELWNNLTIQIRNSNSLAEFKTSIKTFLFKEAYD